MRKNRTGHDMNELIHGSCLIEIQGEGMEKFVNLAMMRGVRLTGVRRKSDVCAEARVLLKDIYRLREVARLSRCRFHILSRQGLPFILGFLRSRPVIPLGIAVFAFLFTFACSLIFSLEVTSPYPITDNQKQQILQAAKDVGLTEGKSRWFIDARAVEKYIMGIDDDLIFVAVHSKGVYSQIEVVYRVNISDEDSPLAPGDIVADYDGVIERLLVRRGTAAVAVGDTVQRGDVLIYGMQGGEEVAASGIIEAVIWAQGYGECSLEEITQEPTGNTTTGYNLCIDSGKPILIAGNDQPGYTLYEERETAVDLTLWRNIILPVEVIKTEFIELKEVKHTRSCTQAKEESYLLAYEAAAGQLPEAAVIRDEQTEDVSIEGERLSRTHVRLTALLDIGAYREGATPPPNDLLLEEEQ